MNKNNLIKYSLAYSLLVAFSLSASQTYAAPVRPKSSPAPLRTQTKPEESTTYELPASGNTNSSRASSSNDFQNEKLFYLFGGFDLGMSTYSTYEGGTVNNSGGASRSGFHGGFRGLGAFYFKKVVLDAGLGWHFINNSGTDPNFTSNKVSVTTRGSYFEISPRYRLDQHWQIGPVFDYWFTTDNGLNPNALSAIPENTSAWLGAQGLYEWMSDSWKYRLGGRWETGMGLDGRSVNIFQVFFQFGFPLFGGGDDEAKDEPRPRSYEELNEADVNRAAMYAEPMPTPDATPWPSVTPEPIPEPAPVAAPIATPKPVLIHKAQEKFVVTLDVNRLPFETNSARLPRYHQDRLREIGRFLAEHGKDWKSLTVSGHADERGSHPYNDNLTKARAQTVRQLLLEGGAPAKKIKAVGYGKRKPIDRRHNEKAWSKNRRVEFEFQGVKDVVIINDGVEINPQHSNDKP